jgi:CrcB protein
MLKLVLIAGFGAAGALSRYGIDSWVGRVADGDFPWSTLIVNVAGSFLLGVLIAVTTERLLLDHNWRVALGIGFLSSFTTFSTYTYDTVRLAEDSAWALALANVFGMVALGIAAALAGLLVGRAV